MKRQGYVRWEGKVGEVRGHGGALHVADEVEIDGAVDGVGKRADAMAQVAEAGALVSGLDGLDRGAQLGGVRDGLAEEFELARRGP